ncbi:MAG: hypothetical protein JWL66_731 [Sphingomonadales bacterium]|nr:hypothetical protein [Sphingomonadales bacterium]
MEIDPKWLARHRCKFGRDPEWQFRRAVSVDQERCSARCGDAHGAVAPGGWSVEDIADRSRPGHGADDRQGADVKRWQPGDWRPCGSGCVWIDCERSGPNGTTSPPEHAAEGRPPVAQSDGWRPGRTQKRGARLRRPMSRWRGSRDCGVPIPRQIHARLESIKPDKARAAAFFGILASHYSRMPPVLSDYVANDSRLKAARAYRRISRPYAKRLIYNQMDQTKAPPGRSGRGIEGLTQSPLRLAGRDQIRLYVSPSSSSKRLA